MPNITTYTKGEVEYQAMSRNNFLLFASGLIIPTEDGIGMLGNLMAPFQTECFECLTPTLHAVRDGKKAKDRRFWIERTKGAAKDSDLACCILWLVAFATRPTYFQVGAADSEQAGILKERIESLLYYNDWLHQFVDIQKLGVFQKSWREYRKNKRGKEVEVACGGVSRLEIMHSDAKSAHGGISDLCILNEVVHVDRWDFMETMLANAAKVPNGVVIIATNAGTKGSIQEKWRNNAINSDRWKCFVWHEKAPWIRSEDVEEQRKMLPSSAFKRLWRGQWVSGTGDALDEEDLDRCFGNEEVKPITKAERGWRYIAGLDLGVKHDHSALVVLGINSEERKIRLAYMQSWEPSLQIGPTDLEVDMTAVEAGCLMVHSMFNTCWFGYDPTQAKPISQRLVKRGLPMREYTFASCTNLNLMARSFIQAVKDRLLECFDDEEGRLRRDFGKFKIVEKNYGFRLVAVSDEYGHADLGTALIICLPKAIEMLARTGLQPDDILALVDEDGISEEEIMEDMPVELREMCGLSSEEKVDIDERKEIDEVVRRYSKS